MRDYDSQTCYDIIINNINDINDYNDVDNNGYRHNQNPFIFFD